MGFGENAGLLVHATLLLIGGAVSVGVTASQWVNVSGGVNWSPSWNSICDRAPQDILRPFGIQLSGNTNYSYCGYSDAITAVRFCAGGITILFALFLFFDGLIMNALRERAGAHLTMYWMIAALWWVAAGFDVYSVSTGQISCERGFMNLFPGSVCNNSVYGVSIAIDALMLIVWCWLIIQVTTQALVEYAGPKAYYSPAIARTATVNHEQVYQKPSYSGRENPNHEKGLAPENSAHTQHSASTQRSAYTNVSEDNKDKNQTGISRM